ncbi:M64 family metallopeptidase [Flavobacterium sp.]|uniref:T9SS type A sorting domain-containing protein n=1 Tax=Flavobacterium sp. TaxID=239 RepID=UPI00286BE05C|nr:M64 family metallopeptidase [Flavobacterium sp.]
MRKTIIIIIIQLISLNTIKSQVFDIHNIQIKGDQNKYINIAVLGDGYTINEQQSFVDKATILIDDLFSQEPWSNYKNYFNIFAIKVISNESGIKHPNISPDCAGSMVPTSNPNNFFGTSFDYYGIHRLVVPTDSQKITSVLASNLPDYDIVIVIANTSFYGGSGGSYATVTTYPTAKEILIHELGHSAGSLADEYYAGDMYNAERANMTQQSNPNLIKWKNWLNNSPIAIIPHGTSGVSSTWFKPTTNACKMEIFDVPFCNVCKENIIENFHLKVNPIVNYTPANNTTINSSNQFINFNLTELMKPIPNTLNIKWQLDSNIFNTNLETYQINQTSLTNGTHTLTATVVDETPFVKTNNHSTIHYNTVTWTIQKNNLGISTVAESNQIGISIYPNPSIDKLNVEVNLEKSSNFSLELVDLNGKIIQTIENKGVLEGKNISSFDVSKLSKGNYIIALKINGANYSKIFVKQ